MRKFFITGVLLLIIATHFGTERTAIAATSTTSLDTYAAYFYNRYAQHFDDFGLTYSVPGYGITDFKSPTTAREWMSLTSYYKYRAMNGDTKAIAHVHNGIVQATKEISSRPAKTQSFNDAEAFFLMITMMDALPTVLNAEERSSTLRLLAEYITEGIKANDTENRALVAGAHWQYALDYLYQNKLVDKTLYTQLAARIKTKIDKAIATSITKRGWYKENTFTTFSLHYHAVSAFMLLSYGNQTHQTKYKTLATTMYYNLKSLTNTDGSVPQKNIGSRPVGLGAQFYLMASMLGKAAGDSRYQKFLTYSQGDRFFIDSAHPNRLEYHADDKNNRQFHDDYAFSDIVELVPQLLNAK